MLKLRGVMLSGDDGREYISILVEHGETVETRKRRLMIQFGLTEREMEVLAYVAMGKTNPEIAIILQLRARTVSKHLEHIFARLGVETRTAAAAMAFEACRVPMSTNGQSH